MAIIVEDGFEYTVDRENDPLPGATGNAFVTTGPWYSTKAVNLTGAHIGRLYTATSIPGFTGSFPGSIGGSNRVLCMESVNVSGGSDYYLQYGNDTGADNQIPADAWFQFWIYICRSGSQLSGIESRHKFLYPTNNGYPSTSDKWIFTFSASPMCPQDVEGGTPFGSPTTGEAYMLIRDASVAPNYSPGGDNASKIGPTAGDYYVAPNAWHLLKIHIDTSNNSSGVFEVWMRTAAQQSFTKTHEWIGGTTPNFTWSGFGAGGHKAFRMPTTIGWTDNSYGAYYYMDDFVLADSEDDLPTYGSLLAGPTNVRWRPS